VMMRPIDSHPTVKGLIRSCKEEHNTAPHSTCRHT
jgi:hypothetical protein